MSQKSNKKTKPARQTTPTLETLLGQYVRERRKELGLRQIDLEGDHDMDRTYISKLENGQFQPCLRALSHLEHVLKLSPGDLFKVLHARMNTPDA